MEQEEEREREKKKKYIETELVSCSETKYGWM
jgi:hypothetical protein